MGGCPEDNGPGLFEELVVDLFDRHTLNFDSRDSGASLSDQIRHFCRIASFRMEDDRNLHFIYPLVPIWIGVYKGIKVSLNTGRVNTGRVWEWLGTAYSTLSTTLLTPQSRGLRRFPCH